MSLQFTKMHGLGNDFIVIYNTQKTISLTPLKILQLAHRKTGIGFDQCLIIEPSQQENIDFMYRIFNADGQEVGQCGNGARCIARYIHHYGLSNKNPLRVATQTSQLTLTNNADNSVTVDFGKPLWAPKHIPLRVPAEADQYHLPLADNTIHSCYALSVGNPHAVTIIEDVSSLALQEIGKNISMHPLFPEQTNASFMQIIDASHIQLRVYERGCGETAACGSAAVAAAAVGRRFFQMAPHITVDLPGGSLVVEWPSLDGSIQLTGPATFVYEGSLLTCA